MMSLGSEAWLRGMAMAVSWHRLTFPSFDGSDPESPSQKTVVNCLGAMKDVQGQIH